ncbi:DUF4383 domain-containing protein [Streptomyces sp. VRA16 Mangrove soil]|uniref:DUF4383 domain-containing protein n=1 Tax=Streptomyces sp. VRA16 Mangrove soil TaxID=2817434 RepID=UPI0035AC299A
MAALGGAAVWAYQEADDARQQIPAVQRQPDAIAAVLSAPDAKVASASLDVPLVCRPRGCVPRGLRHPRPDRPHRVLQTQALNTRGGATLGLNTNGALSVLSIVVGGILLAAAVRGGNAASTVDMALGIAFLLAGFANLFALDSRFNILNFRMQNVHFSFGVGLLLMTGGMYGRVSGGLPHNNPYWRSRHANR